MKKKICFLAYLLVCCLLYGCQTKASLSIISDGEESANVWKTRGQPYGLLPTI